MIAAKGEMVPLREANYTAGPQGSISYKRASVVSHQNVLNRMSAPTGKNLRRLRRRGRTTHTRSIRNGSTSTTSRWS